MVLRDGIVAEEGTHGDLVAKNGVYKKLVERQMMTEQLGEEDPDLRRKRKQSMNATFDEVEVRRLANQRSQMSKQSSIFSEK